MTEKCTASLNTHNRWTGDSVSVTQTHLNADWLIAFFPVEQALCVEVRAACAFMDGRANLLSFTPNYHIGV